MVNKIPLVSFTEMHDPEFSITLNSTGSFQKRFSCSFGVEKHRCLLSAAAADGRTEGIQKRGNADPGEVNDQSLLTAVDYCNKPP